MDIEIAVRHSGYPMIMRKTNLACGKAHNCDGYGANWCRMNLCSTKEEDTHRLIDCLGHNLKWDTVGERDEDKKNTVVILVDGRMYELVYTTHKLCVQCDLVKSSMCKEYCKYYGEKALCNILGSVIGTIEGIFKEVKV